MKSYAKMTCMTPPCLNLYLSPSKAKRETNKLGEMVHSTPM